MLKECSEIEDTFFNINRISIEDIITMISDFPIKRKRFLYSLLGNIYRQMPLNRIQIIEISKFLSSKYDDNLLDYYFKA